MKVVMIETGGWGGICHYTYNLANALAKAGIQDLTVISGKRYELEDLKRDFSLIKFFDSNRSYYSNTFGLINILREERPSLIHIQSILSPRKDWIYILFSRILGIPVIYTVHNILPHEEEERSAIGLKTAFGIIYRCARKLIAHSESNKKEMINEFGIGPEKIEVVLHGNYLFLLPSNGITKEEARKRLGLNMSDKVILSFGAIRRYKGIDYLIKAFKKVTESVPNARLLIAGKPISVGGDTVINSYYAMIKEYGLKEKVSIHSRYIPLMDIHNYFTASDVAIFPYLDTTESGSMQAALAFSKPVIATKVGSFDEVVEDGKNGFLVSPGDVDALAEAITKTLSLDETELSKMGEYSRYIAERRYNWEDIGRKTKRIYEEISTIR